MYIVYDANTNEELYRTSYIEPSKFNNTMEEKSIKIINNQLVEEIKVRNISYRKE